MIFWGIENTHNREDAKRGRKLEFGGSIRRENSQGQKDEGLPQGQRKAEEK